MQLNFLGNGSGFSKTHNNAFFYDNKDIIFIDLSMLNIEKAKALITNDIENIYILITHMHDDHWSGIPLFAQWCYYVKNKIINIVVPLELKQDVKQEFAIKGIPNIIYNLFIANNNAHLWLEKIIPTPHVEELENKCFGYKLLINNTQCIYTGDTSCIDTFIPYLDKNCEFYIDMSYWYGQVHPLWKEEKEKLIELSKNHNIYLMHIDDPVPLRLETQKTNIKVVEVFDEK